MDKDVEIGGKKIKIRSLKWGEKKRLKEEGHNLSLLDPFADNDEMVERVVEISCGDASAIDNDMETYDVYKLFKEIVRLSFVGEEQEKN